MPKWTLCVVLLLALGIRIVLLPLSGFFDARVEVATAFSSYSRLKEGIFLLRHHINPYTSSLVHSPGALLSLMAVLPSASHAAIIFAADLTIGWVLSLIFRDAASVGLVRTGHLAPSLREQASTVVCMLYLLNPLTVISAVGLNSTVWPHLAVVAAIWCATRGMGLLLCLALSVASHLEPPTLLLVLPLSALVVAARARRSAPHKSDDARPYSPNSDEWWSWVLFAKLLVGSVACWLALEFLSAVLILAWLPHGCTLGGLLGMVGASLRQGPMAALRMVELRPNMGATWYFFTEVFPEFRTLFLVAFGAFAGPLFAVPYLVKLGRHPLFCTGLLFATMSLFKNYPTVGDLALWLVLLLMHPDVIQRLRYGLVEALGILFGGLLTVVFWHLWIILGTGNSNFFWAANLFTNAVLVLLLSDALWAAIRSQHDLKQLERSPSEIPSDLPPRER